MLNWLAALMQKALAAMEIIYQNISYGLRCQQIQLKLAVLQRWKKRWFHRETIAI